MRILILGATGMLGHKLCQTFSGKFDVSATVRSPIDPVFAEIFDGVGIINNVDAMEPATIRHAIGSAKPDVVINAIGVIKQLPTSKDVITTLSINSILPHRLAEMAVDLGFRLISISTDCVFDGKTGNYTEDDKPNATDLYGQSKAFGEVSAPDCLTLRTSIIGRELSSEHSLVDWFLSNRGGSVKGFTKAIYSGFPTIVFADIINNLITDHPDLHGLYNVSSSAIDKFELLRLIDKAYGSGVDIEPFNDFEMDRSLNSDKFRSLTGFQPRTWPAMIEIMANDKTPYDKWKK